MAYERCQVDAVGVEIIVTILDDDDAVEDISAATGLKLHFKGPSDSAAVEVSATFHTDGTDGKLKYVKAADDNVNDEKGKWLVQPEFVLGTFDGRTGVTEYYVDKNL